MAIWLLGPDPNGQCCGCETKTTPCDSCGVNCCSTYLSHFFDFANAQSYLANDIGGCYFYPSFIENTAYVRDSIVGTLTNGVLAGATQMSSVDTTVGIGDSLSTAFSLANGQTINVNYTASVTPSASFGFYGGSFLLVSGSGPTVSDLGTIVALGSWTGPASNTFSYTASGNGCFYLLIEQTAGLAAVPAILTSNITINISPNVVPSPMVVQYFVAPEYPSFTGKYGCAECDPMEAQLP